MHTRATPCANESDCIYNNRWKHCSLVVDNVCHDECVPFGAQTRCGFIPFHWTVSLIYKKPTKQSYKTKHSTSHTIPPLGRRWDRMNHTWHIRPRLHYKRWLTHVMLAYNLRSLYLATGGGGGFSFCLAPEGHKGTESTAAPGIPRLPGPICHLPVYCNDASWTHLGVGWGSVLLWRKK